MRNSTAALAAMLLLAPAGAHATEWMNCSGGPNGGSIDLLMGEMPVAAIASVNMEAGGKKWSTQKDKGVMPIAVGQAFETADELKVDITDDALSEIVARLRIIKASEGDSFAAGGTLHIPGVGAWAVSCEGP
jgi:hypothetical protein